MLQQSKKEMSARRQPEKVPATYLGSHNDARRYLSLAPSKLHQTCKQQTPSLGERQFFILLFLYINEHNLSWYFSAESSRNNIIQLIWNRFLIPGIRLTQDVFAYVEMNKENHVSLGKRHVFSATVIHACAMDMLHDWEHSQYPWKCKPACLLHPFTITQSTNILQDWASNDVTTWKHVFRMQ